MDWAIDDQPIWMRTRAGPILSVPYPIEINDLPALVFRRHTGRQFAEMVDRPVRRDARPVAEIPAGVRGRAAPVHHRPAVPPARLPRRRRATSWRTATSCGSPPPARSPAIARACRRAPCRGADPDSRYDPQRSASPAKCRDHSSVRSGRGNETRLAMPVRR